MFVFSWGGPGQGLASSALGSVFSHGCPAHLSCLPLGQKEHLGSPSPASVTCWLLMPWFYSLGLGVSCLAS